MFSKISQEFVRAEGGSLWNQCLEELQRMKGQGASVPVEEVDRLAKLVSHRIQGDFRLHVQEVVSEMVNGFMDELPF